MLQMTEYDFKFYEDQKSSRKSKCISSNDTITSSDQRFQRRVQEKQHSDANKTGFIDEPGPSDTHGVMSDNQLFSSDCDSSSQSSESSFSTFSNVLQPSMQNRINWPNLA